MSRQRIFESGDKARKLLAHQARPAAAAATALILCVKSSSASVVCDSKLIHEIFSKIHHHLDLLSHIEFPKIGQELMERQAAPISMDKIMEAIAEW